MAEDKVEPREFNWRQLFPWVELFQGFKVALDVNKLLLAAGGILAMALGWWLLAVVFYSTKKPVWPSTEYSTANVKLDQEYPDEAAREAAKKRLAWTHFKEDRDSWNLLHEMAGPADSGDKYDAADLAQSPEEFDAINRELEAVKTGAKPEPKLAQEARENPNGVAAKAYRLLPEPVKPAGTLRTWPFFENRGPNPYSLVFGQAGTQAEDGTTRAVPWERGHFSEWFVNDQAPVLLEPLYKFLRPVKYFFSPKAGGLIRFYLILVLAWTLAVWAFFGGAITRIAVVQVARKEKIGLTEAVRFVWQRYLSYFTAPVFPLLFAAALVVLMILFGFVHLVPILGDVADGLLWWLMLLLALVMAVVLVGLVGWPLMAATISAEGADGWEAVSRSYSYIFQAVWHFVWYSLVALAYGAVVVFFVAFMGSFLVYLSKWGVSQTPGSSYFNRDPAYLFVYAPTSYQWRAQLLQGMKVEGKDLVEDNGRINPDAYNKYIGRNESYTGTEKFKWYNHLAAFLVAVWVYLVFLGVIGFGYSYFWSASTIIYLLLRRKVDDAEMDEIYLEEEDQDEYRPPVPSAPAPTAPVVSGPTRTMVEAPTLRTPPAPAPTPPAPAPTEPSTAAPESPSTPPSGDGNSTPGGTGAA